jgi:hypothetical protein
MCTADAMEANGLLCILFIFLRILCVSMMAIHCPGDRRQHAPLKRRSTSRLQGAISHSKRTAQFYANSTSSLWHYPSNLPYNSCLLRCTIDTLRLCIDQYRPTAGSPCVRQVRACRSRSLARHDASTRHADKAK